MKVQKIEEIYQLYKIQKLYVNGTVTQKLLNIVNKQKILGNICFSKQIFKRKQLLGVPVYLLENVKTFPHMNSAASE